MTFKNCEGKTIEQLFVLSDEFVTRRIGSDLYMFGCNASGTLGNNTTSNSVAPVRVCSCADWGSIEINRSGSAFGIKKDGTLWTWGNNDHGQLLRKQSWINNLQPYRAFYLYGYSQYQDANRNWSTVSSYGHHAAGVKTDGTLWTWGRGTLGALGNSNTISHSSPVQTVAGGTNWKSVSTGCHFTNAIKSDGTLWAWGSNSYGTLGDGSGTNKSSPVQNISNSVDWKVSAAGCYTALGIKIDGSLWGWGDAKGLGIGTPAGRKLSSPVQTSAGGTNWKKVSTSGNHTVAIKMNGTLWTWGYNDFSQLANGNCVNTFSPISVCNAVTNWRTAKAGYKSTIAVKSDSCACMWGKLPAFCGDGSIISCTNHLFVWGRSPIACVVSGGPSSNPQKVYPINYENCDWIDVSTFERNVAAIRCDNKLYVAGWNSAGQLGLGDTTTRYCFTNLPGNWCEIAVGRQYAMGGIRTDGTLWTWGAGSGGQLGNNSEANVCSPVQTAAGGSNWKGVEFGLVNNAIAVKHDGTLWTWGWNRCGQLGSGNLSYRSSPGQTVAGGTNWTCGVFGRYSALGLKSDGTLWAWGSADYGATTLGSNRSSPTQILSGSTWNHVSTKESTTGAIRSDGTLWMWGNGAWGALGNLQSNTCTASPVQTVAGGNTWCKLSVGNKFTAAIKSDGTMWMWGENSVGGVCCTIFGHVSSPTQQTSGASKWKLVDVDGPGVGGGGTIAVADTTFQCAPIFQGNTSCGFIEIKDAAISGCVIALLKYNGE